MVDTFTPLQILALSKLTKENAVKSIRGEVKAGSYPATVEVFVRVDGEEQRVVYNGALNVAEDGSQRPTSNLLSIEVLALLFQRMGIQRERAMDVLQEVATEYLTNGQKVGEGLKELITDLEGFQERYGQMLEALPKIKKNGSVSLAAEMTIIESPMAKATGEVTRPPRRVKVA